MRKVWIVLAGLLVLTMSASAEFRSTAIDISLAGNTAGTNTASDVWGYVEDIYVLATDGSATGKVDLAAVPADSTISAYSIATNTVSNDKLFKPRVDGTDVGGTALTNDPPGRYCLFGETVRFVVRESVTNKTWRCRIKTSDN